MAEVLLDAYAQVTGVPSEFRLDLRNQNRGLGERYPLGLRALQLPDTKVFSYFLKTFGRPDREKTCDCERTSEPSMTQVLHLANGETLNQKLTAKEGVLSRFVADNKAPEAMVEEAFLSSLARFPTDKERTRLGQAIADANAAERRAALEDAYWAILSTREFLFNH
jgi:hypothetical protein